MGNNNTNITILPQNIEAERALLCSLTLDNSQIPVVIEQGLRSSDFYDSRNKTLFEIIVELYKESITPDLIAITNKLKELNLSEKVDLNYIIGLLDYLPAPTNAKHYTEIIKDEAIKRRYLSFSEQISLLIREGTDIKEIKKTAENLLDNDNNVTSGDIPFSELIKDKKEIVETFAHGIKIQNGTIFGLVGATSVGKTEFALDVSGAYASQSLDNTVLFCEYEGTKQDFIHRIAAKKDYPIKDENSIYLEKPDFLRIAANIRKYRNQNILIVIDYLQRFARKLQAEDKHATDSLRFYVNKIYEFFDNLRANYPNISVCFLSSLSKSGINEISGQSRKDRISLLNGIKESGDVQYDLDYAYAMLFSDETSNKLDLSRFNNDTGKPRKYMHTIVIKSNRTGEPITDSIYTFDTEKHCYEMVGDEITGKYEQPEHNILKPNKPTEQEMEEF